MNVFEVVFTFVGDNLDADAIWGYLAQDELANDVRGYIYNELDGLQLTFDVVCQDVHEHEFDAQVEAWFLANDIFLALLHDLELVPKEMSIDIAPQRTPAFINGAATASDSSDTRS